jgi:hypothetical protein
MTPEIEADLRTTVASLRVKTSSQELLLLALMPTLQQTRKRRSVSGWTSRVVDRSEVERETAGRP